MSQHPYRAPASSAEPRIWARRVRGRLRIVAYACHRPRFFEFVSAMVLLATINVAIGAYGTTAGLIAAMLIVLAIDYSEWRF